MMPSMPTPRMDIIGRLPPSEIRDRYRSCRNVLERERWHVLHLMTREGYALSAAEAALVVGRTPDAVRRIIRRYNKEGPDGLKDHRAGKSGRKSVLTAEQRQHLFADLKKKPEDGGIWTGPKVSSWVRQRVGIHVSNVTGWQYLRLLGFTLQVPRPKHSDTATEPERTIWKKNTRNHSLRSQNTASQQRR